MNHDDPAAFTSLISLDQVLDLSKETQWKMHRFLKLLKNALELKVGKYTTMRTVAPITAGALAMDGISPDEIRGFVDQLNTIIAWRMPKPKNERTINRKRLYSLDLAEAAPPLLKIESIDEREVEVAVSYPPAVDEILDRFSLAGVAAKKPTPPPTFYITKGDEGRYLHNGKLLPVVEGKDYWKVFDILYSLKPEGGFASYKRMRSDVKKRIAKTKELSDESLNKYILDKLDRHNGFLHHAKISATVPGGKQRFESVRGKGIEFNNRRVR